MNERIRIKDTVEIPHLAPPPSNVPIEEEGLNPIIQEQEISPEDLSVEEREGLEYYLDILEKKKKFVDVNDSEESSERDLFVYKYAVLLLKAIQSLGDNPYDYLSFHVVSGSSILNTKEMAQKKLDFEGKYSVNKFFSLSDEDKYRFVENLEKEFGE